MTGAGSGVLDARLRVEPIGATEFAAHLHDYGGVAFGGDALARAALAAARTCDGRALHALHASFLRPLPAGAPIRLAVAPLSDGRRLARRRVDLRHGDRLLCQVTASFVGASEGDAWQEVAMPPVARPEELPSDLELARAEGWEDWDFEQEEFAWRFVGRPWESGSAQETSEWCVWLRPRQPLRSEPGVHAAALAYASDLWSQQSAARRLGRRLDAGGFASLDHVLRVHRPAPWDDWLLLANWSEVAHAGRALWHRRFFARDGALIASVSQEALVAG